ncbi:MAG: nucleotide pyrophosphohydrolase [Streptosporangiales bacterium]|nr:nucleotide pyrophosphohydrolase [Streptosporangiales bacterium]
MSRKAIAASHSGAITSYDLVCEFHAASGEEVPATPQRNVPLAQRNLRQQILEEEVQELREAVVAADLVGIADALADIVYVACGTAITYGIPFDAVFAEVHRSNMTKIGPDGPTFRADGKIMKGPHFEPPDIESRLFDGVRR